MPKILLTREELLELDHALRKTYQFGNDLRESASVARLIHYPPIPSELSESLVIHCADRFFGAGWAADFGGSLCDVILTRQGEQKTVEVKATGQTNFQEFKPKDLASVISCG